MNPLFVEELANQRHRDLLAAAERARRGHRLAASRSGRRPPRRWRRATGLALVRLGMRLAGGALAGSVMVVRRPGGRAATVAVIWDDPAGSHGQPPTPRSVAAASGGRSPSRS